MSDYVAKTIDAYNQSPDKFVNSTKDMTPLKEFERFTLEVKKIGVNILDAGCAFGRDTNAFQKVGFNPTGIDLSDGLIQKGHELYPNLDIRKMDVRNLEFSDNSFAGIWSAATLLHLKDKDILKALKEFYRVLMPKGVLFISFKKGEGTGEVLETFSSDTPRFYNFKTIDSLTEVLKAVGFDNVDARYINEKEVFGSDKRDLDWLHCFAAKQS